MSFILYFLEEIKGGMDAMAYSSKDLYVLAFDKDHNILYELLPPQTKLAKNS
jgi:hypothetical protein